MNIGVAVKMVAKQAWGRWVRFAEYVDADPYTLLVPVSAVTLGLFIMLFSW